MLIICPKCFTQYQILDKDISLKGKKCHCSACGCYFDQEEDVVELTPSQNEKSTLEKTMDIFMESRGTHFEPCIVDAIIRCKDKILKIANN